MKHNFKYKLIAIIFLILLVFPIFSSNIQAAINEGYFSRYSFTGNENVDDAAKDSNVLDMLAIFVYSVAGLVENIVGGAFRSLTGTNDFPWADRILFNSVPLLDVNFFNPHDNSLFSQNNDILGTIVRNTYFTILSIAVAFLGIIVAIAAIRMAISSLASEKAKYKEALTKWLFSIVMLFLIHNLMAFVFFVNEKMVEVASSLVTDTLDKTNLLENIENLENYVGIDEEETVNRFLDACQEIGKENETKDEREYILSHIDIAAKLIQSKRYQESIIFDAMGNETHDFRNGFFEFNTGNGKQSIEALYTDVTMIAEPERIWRMSWTSTEGNTYLKDFLEEFDYTLDDLEDNGFFTGNSGIFDINSNWSADVRMYEFIRYYNGEMTDKKEILGLQLAYLFHIRDFLGNDHDKITQENFKKYVNAMVDVYSKTTGVGQIDSTSPDILSSLAEYFKTTAYTFETDDKGKSTGWKATKLTIQGALLYAIFVFQSIMYFFAYIRRFFYIVVLAIMAPAIVVIDFLSKAVS